MNECTAAADLGMFSMFGLTGAPLKGALTKGAEIFACRKCRKQWATPEWTRGWWAKKSPVFEENWQHSWHADGDD